ncbi:class I SAM-dependent methyltransferase [Ectothiorhodospira variabilis]|uniref:class I SAM-dependent methyltransferase n=1 Tax=Ectothiorhodospira variabilis TaxID=505694 RepID=UPI001EFB1FA4|nr:class I SAM-dependent methyltransferase [Ectothiorhodospira variabilis]MCG5495945.1 class I SAM-dependent methyltransferase [Ectothiorhodospira variabilis]MCG5505357.1 class I SAM-dependent methyltransferase [Ectothiorhodospira variabilis]MCG5508543.1 class I SAM-dependent methyltransferase [Ectothiorhodospira variabilis]
MPEIRLLSHLLLDRLYPFQAQREPEPDLIMESEEQATAFRDAGGEFGTIAPTYLFHTLQVSQRLREGMKVFDLACGPCNQLAQIARLNPGVHFTGVDASESMLENARETLKRYDLENVSLLHGRIEQLAELPHQAFDMVISTMSMHHLPDLETLNRSFEEAARKLKVGGAIYIADFGRLKLDVTRRYFAYSHSQTQTEIFTRDYLNSLRAAFSCKEFRQCLKAFGDDVSIKSTAIVPFMVLMHRGTEHALDSRFLGCAREIYDSFNKEQQKDFEDLVRFFSIGGVKTPSIL